MHRFDEMPPVPLTLEGAGVLHQMLRVRWAAWRALEAAARAEILEEASEFLEGLEKNRSACYGLLGHKGDLLLIHFRDNFDGLLDAQHGLAGIRLWDYLDQPTSYLSVVELGLYESTGKVYGSLAEQGVEPHSDAWKAAIEETIARQAEAMRPRLYPEIPPARFVCFYPMDRRRGEQKNWYQVPFEDRQLMMQQHGAIGRRYAGTVKQIISGSIGFDDWEWGVDLFAEDPLVFKRLIYEMRFDEVSAVYALFGAFYVGRRMDTEDLRDLLTV
jgi:peroxiredoxin